MRILVGILMAVSLLAAGCATTSHPVHNVENAPIILPPGKTLSMQQITAAIMRAGTRLGWQMNPEGPGRVAGRLAVRTHTAVIGVEHNTKSYSIKYRDSTNLNAADGMIHRQYNNWIQNLDKNIRAELTQ
jgi:hypothetical protein